ncbi:hypothetical protein Acr_17g0003670 [Actinidia rufa]|uniref:NB-ARC domain-containing disease resistance protein n=1 Tax=Actinidia rufa TaxID=165716 RepID=A0A7J0G1Y8_9ERIC|nr:hypothetical protein Acr_17g0003670 [Actinidia rufa]
MIGNIVQQINHFSGQDEKMKTLRKNYKRLSCQAADVKEKVEAEEFKSGKKRKRAVENWLGELEMMKNKVQKLEEIQESQISSLLSGNRIDKLIKEIEELYEEGRFREGLLLDTCKTKAEQLLAPELTIQTSKQNLEEIFKYLLDDEVWCIGIHGIGGVGKTTLALHIYNRLVQDVETLGYRPYWVTVSQENSIGKLQNDIAKNLELDFSNEGDERKRAAILSQSLKSEKCVLILDDVWEKIALDKVGIPTKVNERKTCKLILTTRSRDVCRRIGCDAKFKVQPLNEEEAWKLFEEKLGKQTELSHEVRDIATFCGSQVCWFATGHYYHGWKHERGVIDEGKPWQAKFDEGHSMLNTLERSCLLESCNSYDGRRCVKMHDLMRDMALKITKAGHPQFMVKAGVGLKDIPAEREWTEDLDKVSLMGNVIKEIPRGRSPRCPRLSTLLLNENSLTKVADSFFERMHALHVLDLSRNPNLERLPNSISDLENLTALKLQFCKSLTYVPPLGKLRALQELDLSYTHIKDVPEGVDRLVNLKILNMEGTERLERLPSGTLGKLSHLQRLGLHFTLGPVEVQAEELERLRELKEIAVQFSDIDGLKQFVKYIIQKSRFWGQLDKYFLKVKAGEFNDGDINKVMILHDPFNVNGGEGEDGILLPYDLQLLIIHRCSFARGRACLYYDVFPSLRDNATLMKGCELSNCEGIESIISSSTSSYSSTSFQSLLSLYLYCLPDFVSLFRSKFLGFAVIAPSCGTFSNLKDLSVSSCPKIKSLFTSISLLLFPNLEVITVKDCVQIKEIIETVHDDGLETSFFRNHDDNNHDVPLITLPKLKKIELLRLPELKSVFERRIMEIMVCESIEEISVYECPKLRRLPFSLPLVNGQLSAPTTLKRIIAYRNMEWWESLEWDDPNAKDALRPYLVTY